MDQIYDSCDTNDTDEDDDEEVEEFCKSRFRKITLLSSTVIFYLDTLEPRGVCN